jgi:transcriptional regulator with XRE-family HTH domain
MEQMIDKDLIRELRSERTWSQDQLASISGLSPRTVQRIERDGICSLESKKALAAAFEVNAVNLNVNTIAINAIAANKRGLIFGFAGAILGLLSAYAGITMSLISNHINFSEAGLYYGGIGASCGIFCAIIGMYSKTHRTSAA